MSEKQPPPAPKPVTKPNTFTCKACGEMFTMRKPKPDTRYCTSCYHTEYRKAHGRKPKGRAA